MLESKISVIIPVYNVEKYLDYCVSSVLAQDYENLEIILVDDGSTDSSGEMCDKYAEEDKRIRVIHKENGGLSSARNAGTKIMTGDYLTFIDSDDYVRADYVSRMYDYIINDNTDIVVCSNKKLTTEEDYNIVPEDEAEHYIYDQDNIKYHMVSRRVPMYAHGKLYKASLSKYLEFPVGRLYEDVPTIWNVIKHVDKVTYATDKLYFYRQRADSIVNLNYKHGRMDQVYFSEQIYSEVTGNPKLLHAAGSRCFFAAADNYSLVSADFPDDKKYLVDCIKKYRKDVFKDSSSGIKLKFMAMLSYISPAIVRVLGKIYKNNNYKKWKMV